MSAGTNSPKVHPPNGTRFYTFQASVNKGSLNFQRTSPQHIYHLIADFSLCNVFESTGAQAAFGSRGNFAKERLFGVGFVCEHLSPCLQAWPRATRSIKPLRPRLARSPDSRTSGSYSGPDRQDG
ncbi:unnamed protein product [Pleuronectes platessa]|uniref:Uncharacterized protein n=1 Tax=Pleuronectes platessa TaxID=8262 RepID=A0A9N7UEE5_PLEPL|nr:unnamed protein product [Pleuronectes platessa]